MATTTETIDRDYIDNFSIKEMAQDELVPKYFPDEDTSNLTVGMIGYASELISNGLEDSFNTTSSLYEEQFPNRAKLPTSIYSHAAIFQLAEGLATAATCTFLLVLNEDRIIENMTTSNGINYFYIDKDTQILVEDHVFVLDYDIEIRSVYKESQGDYAYSAQYMMTEYENSISGLANSYIKIRRSANGYMALQVKCHQCLRSEQYESIINNTKVNFPTIDISFSDQLAGFDVFYKAPTDTDYSTQLEKLVEYSAPQKTPFCYWRIVDENVLRLSFSNRDAYFQPKFNSELKIVLYTTEGEGGNFDTYTGTDVSVVTTATNYDYNANLGMVAKPMTASSGGDDAVETDELQALTVESYRTATAYTTDNDLNAYFENWEYRYNNKCKFMKARDDVVDRLFTGFLLIKNGDYIYPTNTLKVNLNLNQMTQTDTYKYILDPGYLFKYNGDEYNISLYTSGDSEKSAQYEEEYQNYLALNDLSSSDYGYWEFLKDNNYSLAMTVFDDGVEDHESIGDFLFANPFLISVTKKPNLVGFYLTVVNQTSIVDFINQNSDVFDQFVIEQLKLYRTLESEKKYTLTTAVMPSVTYESGEEPVTVYTSDDDPKSSEDMMANNLRIIVAFTDSSGLEVCFVELMPTEVDSSGNYTFTGDIYTDDHVTTTYNFRITSGVTYMDSVEDMLVPMTEMNAKIYTLYNYGITNNNFAAYDSTLEGYTWTNVYDTSSDTLTFIKPLNMVRSTLTFDDDRLSTVESGDVTLSAFPFVKYSVLTDEDMLAYFIETFSSQYAFLEEAIDLLQTSTHIDIKFYNTYGKSRTFVVGDDGDEYIDTINISIGYSIWVESGTDKINAEKELKSYIKEFIEEINENGTNNFFNSNLVRSIENNFSYVDHMKFEGINSYSTDVQTIKNNTIDDLDSLTKEERRTYVPEVLVVDTDNISLTFYEA